MASSPQPLDTGLVTLSVDPGVPVVAAPDPQQIAEELSQQLVAPKRLRRVGKRGFQWDIPRSFPGYRADMRTGVVGNAVKCVLKPQDGFDGPLYLAKWAQKHGTRETYTEFFINRFGSACGFNMAHSALALLDDSRVFVTRLFVDPPKIDMVHGSLMIENYFQLNKDELQQIDRKGEQEFYSIDFVVAVIEQFCGQDSNHVLDDFFRLLVFDAVIGSMDRHAQNWGVLRMRQPDGADRFRFSPAYDSARALLWATPDDKLETYRTNDAHFRAHILRAKPCIGPERNHPRVNSCNHFELVENLGRLYPDRTKRALLTVPKDAPKIAARIANQFPFDRAFTALRKKAIVKMIDIRTEMLFENFEKGGY